MTILFSDDRNTYRDFRLPFLDRLKMLADAVPHDQRPLIDRAIIELTAIDEKKLHPMLMITHEPDAASAPLFPSHEKAVEEFQKPNESLKRLIEKRAAPKPKKKSPKK